jgi:uncharacterized protein YkwD
VSRRAGLLGRLAAVVGAAVAALPAPGALAASGVTVATSAAQGDCPHASAGPGEATPTELRHATLCLLNRARAKSDAPPLSIDHDLTSIARRHSKVMLALECFPQHQCAGELPLRGRLRRSGYLDGATHYLYAEVVGYDSTPKEMVGNWLDGTAAEDLLSADYSDVGIGPRQGAPEQGIPDADFYTYTVDLASRTP